MARLPAAIDPRLQEVLLALHPDLAMILNPEELEKWRQWFTLTLRLQPKAPKRGRPSKSIEGDDEKKEECNAERQQQQQQQHPSLVIDGERIRNEAFELQKHVHYIGCLMSC